MNNIKYEDKDNIVLVLSNFDNEIIGIFTTRDRLHEFIRKTYIKYSNPEMNKYLVSEYEDEEEYYLYVREEELDAKTENKIYEYFLTFSIFSNNETSVRTGTTSVDIEYKIDNIDRIRDLEEILRNELQEDRKNKIDKIIITNIILLNAK